MSSFSLSRALERYFIPWPRMDWPVDWTHRFGREAPLGLELGFGNGEFLEGLAREHPDRNWVGVEMSWFSVQRLLRRLQAHDLANVRVVQGDGNFILEHLFPPNAANEIYINHPDPWPKVRHHGRRLIQPGFVELLSSRLERRGRLTVVTDHAEYAEWVTEVLLNQTAFTSGHPTPSVHSLPGRRATKYERKGVDAGSAIHYFVWENANPVERTERPETLEESLPNALLEGAADAATLLADFEPSRHTESVGGSTVHIQFLAAYRHTAREEWLVETRVEEEGFTQHLLLSVSHRAPRFLVRPSPVGFPRPTAGLKRAVRLLTARILAAHPTLTVYTSTVGKIPQKT